MKLEMLHCKMPAPEEQTKRCKLVARGESAGVWQRVQAKRQILLSRRCGLIETDPS